MRYVIIRKVWFGVANKNQYEVIQVFESDVLQDAAILLDHARRQNPHDEISIYVKLS